MDRHAVKTVICLRCETEQISSPACQSCGHLFGAYTCLKCNLFDHDTSKQQFHCEKCGICRIGGRENFFHCDTCGGCYTNRLQGNHVCVPNVMHQDCPICCEYLFDSREWPQVLRCGHALHQRCLENLQQHGSYRCPLCSACFSDMTDCWRELDAEIASSPLEGEHADRQVDILCNDCHQEAPTRFHSLGLKCSACGSYNSRRV